VIDHCRHIPRTRVGSKLFDLASAFAHNALDVRHLLMRAEFVCFAGHKFKQLFFNALSTRACAQTIALQRKKRT
jgi:hypothetical protein